MKNQEIKHGNQLDQLLDESLQQADRHLLPEACHPAGNVIRRRATQQWAARKQRRRAMNAALLAMCLLVGWGLLMPDKQDVEVASFVTEPNPEQLLADLRRQLLANDKQLDELRSNAAATRQEFQLARFAQSADSALQSYRRNRTAWLSLENFVEFHDRSTELAESDCWQFQLLASHFSDTQAGQVAKTILKTNRIPESLGL